MPDMSGLDFVRSLEVKPLVVFTTAYSDYAVEGYKVEAIDYLLKPFGQAELNAAAESVKRQYTLCAKLPKRLPRPTTTRSF